MCGIAGIVEAMGTAASLPCLRAMNATLVHRGPDAGGAHCSSNVGIAHRRLSIIDRSRDANQPLFNEDQTVSVVFNGEIYNFRELREQLKQRGHTFRTSTDSEVLVHGWEEYGTRLPEFLTGMFAFAIHDSRRHLLFAARDHMGKKPFFYHSTSDRLVFASEIKAVRAAGRIPMDLDPQAIVEYVAYGNSLGERTIFQAIRKLPPAHWMLVETQCDHIKPRIERYWQLSFEPDASRSETEWLESLDDVAEAAVRRRLVSDVPLGCFLSGGVDSSLVTAYAARAQPGLQTFSIGFHESHFDETAHATTVAQHLGTEHHTEHVTPDALEVLPDLVAAYDEPFADSSAIPTWYLSRMTRRHVTVALSGDGGDELHSGYTRYGRMQQLGPLTYLMTGFGRSTLRSIARLAPRGSRLNYILDGMSRTGFELYDFGLGNHPWHVALLRRDFLTETVKASLSKQADDFEHCDNIPFAARLQYVDTQNYLPDDILVKVDRASMAHSLEVRSPLLDKEFAELSAQIPPALNRHQNDGKRLLKKLAERYVPPHVLYRPKMGFAIPLDHWVRTSLRPLIEDMVHDCNTPLWDFFDRDQVTSQFRHHLAGHSRRQSSLWRTLFFYKWADTCLTANTLQLDMTRPAAGHAARH